ncbi:TonB-dependent receptor [Chitinophagaceae bacterium 26-R-25]|nr:TonB-dependent receptor [Chitinophagaceae bacterium 26-R-25]
MKLTTVLIFATCLQVAAKGYSQITLNESNTPLKKVFKKIQKQSGYDFLCTYDLLQQAGNVTVQVNNSSLDDVLEKILKGKGLTYTMMEKTIVIKKDIEHTKEYKENSPAAAEIRGVVKDNNGIPVAGVSVIVKGTKKGTSTDASGAFTIDAKEGDVLEFSSIGYKKISITIAKNLTVSVIIEAKVVEANEVVVIGYGTQKKVNLTGSVATISNTDLKGRPNQDMLTSIQGLVPGVTVISRPGETPEINFRGRGNLGKSAPLFVINGVIADQNIFSNLDPNSIESISFLKDAASASIYGSRAAYGVVLVTTKSGKKGKMDISYNGFVGVKSPTYLPDMLNSWEYAQLLNEGRVNSGLAPVYSDAEIEKFKNGSDPDHYPNTRWFDLVLDKKVVTTQHSLNFSGGTEKTRYFTGLDYLYDDQFMPGQGNKRYNLHSRLSSNVTNWLTINSDISYIRTQFDTTNGAPSNYKMQFEPPIMVARQSNGEWGSIAGGASASQTYINYNPLRTLHNNDWAHSNSANTILDLGFDLKPVKGFTISGQASYTGIENKSKSYTALQDNVKDFTTGDEIPGTGNETNKMDMSWGSTTRLLFTGTAKYDWSNDKHNFSVLGGTSYEQNNFQGLSASRKNFPTDDLTDISSGSNAPLDITNGGGVSDYRLNSYFGRINYSFLNRYLFEANIRADGSSRFNKDHRWGVFPSVSAGWLLSNESFMKNVSWVNLLKLRGSYGKLGNINNVGNYDYFQKYSTGLDYNFDKQSVSGIYESQPANATLGWENVAITDFGADFELFNHKLSFTADYYIKKTTDILLAYNVPLEVGVFSNPSQNIGKLQNRGVELALNYKTHTGNFHYSVGGNIAFNKNKITDLAGSDNMIYGGGDVINYIYKVGYGIGSYYGYKTDGLYTQDEINKGNYYVLGRTPEAGDIKYVPQRANVAFGDEITGDDRVVIGNDVPKFTYGINVNLQYKNFDLSAFGQGINGADVAFENNAYMAFFEKGNSRKFHLQRWTTQNPNPNAIYPRIYGGTTLDDYNRQNFSNYQLFDADYFRIKMISFGYALPEKMLSKYKIISTRFFVNLENMFTIRADKKMKDFDPETASSRSLSIGTKTISFGINLNF